METSAEKRLLRSRSVRVPQIKRLLTREQRAEALRSDVRRGLTARPKSLPPKYFYDARGSELFEEITRLPEYYLTRTEVAILEQRSDAIAERCRPTELVEIGSGSSRKTRLLLEAMRRVGGNTYRAIEVSEDALQEASRRLAALYPWLNIEGVVGDFGSHLDAFSRGGRRLVVFLGSTIGNLDGDERIAFLRRVRTMLSEGDHFLLGIDLAKDPARLTAAYNDSRGVTADFNRNVLHVLNRELHGDLPVQAFEHVAFFDEERSRMDLRLRAERAIDARMADLDLDVHFEPGEDLHTEVSCKFTRNSVERALALASMRLLSWNTDPAGDFALALAEPA